MTFPSQLKHTDTMSLGYGEVSVGGLLVPAVDDDGMVTMELTAAQIDFDDPDAQFGVLEGWVVEFVLDLVGEWVTEPLAESVLDVVLGEIGIIEIGGPFAFEFVCSVPVWMRDCPISMEIPKVWEWKSDWALESPLQP